MRSYDYECKSCGLVNKDKLVDSENEIVRCESCDTAMVKLPVGTKMYTIGGDNSGSTPPSWKGNR